MSDDDYFEEEEQLYVPEGNFWERAGGGAVAPISKSTKGASPEDKFKTIVNSKFLSLRQHLKLNDKDLEIVINGIQNLNKPQFKNPLAYVLGFYVNTGRVINKERFKIAVKLIEDKDFMTQEDYVTSPDIIRYAILWNTLRK